MSQNGSDRDPWVNQGKATTNSREIHPIIMDGITIKIVEIKSNLPPDIEEIFNNLLKKIRWWK